MHIRGISSYTRTIDLSVRCRALLAFTAKAQAGTQAQTGGPEKELKLGCGSVMEVITETSTYRGGWRKEVTFSMPVILQLSRWYLESISIEWEFKLIQVVSLSILRAETSEF